MIDLHIHTNFSDGQYSPAQIAQKANDLSLKVFAITDHDTIDGLLEAEKECEKINTERKNAGKEGIVFVKGVELNIERPFSECHLLGLALKNFSKELVEITDDLKKNREKRNEKIIEKFFDCGIHLSIEKIKTEMHTKVLGRPHIAQYLSKHKIVKNEQDAFDRFLGRGRPCYIERKGAEIEKCVFAIKKSGGVAVLAHPLSLYLSWKRLEEVFLEYRKIGVEGVEAYHSAARWSECVHIEELARKYGYFITAGSDFHGEKIRADRTIGHTSGGKEIEDKFYYEELKKHIC